MSSFLLAGETGLEPAAYGFGDRHSTIELLPCIRFLIRRTINYSRIGMYVKLVKSVGLKISYLDRCAKNKILGAATNYNEL